jgi:hypothetical protein
MAGTDWGPVRKKTAKSVKHQREANIGRRGAHGRRLIHRLVISQMKAKQTKIPTLRKPGEGLGTRND